MTSRAGALTVSAVPTYTVQSASWEKRLGGTTGKDSINHHFASQSERKVSESANQQVQNIALKVCEICEHTRIYI